ncbi:MAG: hypothetical protein IKG47_04275 [Oscillospiraceae bacterium]|nr:hypothetical protein [Oscillospiraceae bacterium]
MKKKKYSKTEEEIFTVIADTKRLADENRDDIQVLKNADIVFHGNLPVSTKSLTPRTWQQIFEESKERVGLVEDIDVLFTPEELANCKQEVRMLNDDFNNLHKLEDIDVYIAAFSGIIGAAVDILLVGIPQRSPEGLKAKPLSDWIRQEFEKKFPPEEMERLANTPEYKVPYDAQDNRNTVTRVEVLSTYYHRLLSLGHDPLLGLVVGVFDIMTGRMTTIDKQGKFVSQVMEVYADRKESDIFIAIAKQLRHFTSDVNTAMGLPAPLMGLCNLLQFGSIGEYDQTIAEIVQGMYYEGYDFVHFCSLNVSVMLIEVITRVGYAIKRIKEGHSIKESIPFSLDRTKHPKLETMLFISHSLATAANAGKVVLTENPVAINYIQWIAFTKYSYKQLKWCFGEKHKMRHEYVVGRLNEDLDELYNEIVNPIVV